MSINRLLRGSRHDPQGGDARRGRWAREDKAAGLPAGLQRSPGRASDRRIPPGWDRLTWCAAEGCAGPGAVTRFEALAAAGGAAQLQTCGPHSEAVSGFRAKDEQGGGGRPRAEESGGGEEEEGATETDISHLACL